MCEVTGMARDFDWEEMEQSRQVQINILRERYDQVCRELLKERQLHRISKDPKEKKRSLHHIKKLEGRKQAFKRVLLEKYGEKLETRGRPPLSPEKKAANNQTKLTLRVKKENAEYIASLKQDNLIDSYGQLFDFLITAFRQQNRQG